MKKFTFLSVFAFMANIFLSSTAFGQITLVNFQQATTSTTTLTINKPGGLAVGDVMIANIIQSDNDGADGGDLSNATASGWTLIAGNQTGIVGSGGDEFWGTLLYKVATASDVSATNFAFTMSAAENGDGASGAIMAFRSVDITGGVTETGAAGGPFDVDPDNLYQNVSNDNSLTANAITTVSSNAAVIMFGVIGNNFNLSNWAATSPASLTEIYDQAYNASLDNGSGAAWGIKASAGSTGSGTATISGSAYNGSILIALKPAPPTATLTPSSAQYIAAGGTVNFTATAHNYGGSGNYTYTWTAAGATIPGSNPNSIGAASDSKTLTFPSTGNYTVSVSIARAGESTQITNTTSVIVVTAPATPDLWASSSNGTIISSFSVTYSVYFAGPTTVLTPTFPGTTTGGTSTAAIARSDKPTPATGYYYWLPNTSGNSGVVELFGADANGNNQTRIGSLDLNGASGTSLGFVRLGIGPDGTAWILAGSGSQLYLAKIKPNGVTLNSSLPAADQFQVEDDNVTLIGGAAATFQNGDLCISGTGNIYALANDGSGVTQIFVGSPTGTSTTFTKRWDLVDPSNAPFSGRVNGVAFSLLGSLYITTDDGLYFIDASTVNGPAGTVQCALVRSQTGLQDLASNVFPQQSTLPVQLGSFTVSKQGSNAVLNWTTATELNSDHFEIERSYDGINFTTVGNKLAAGNSVSDINYQYIDPISLSSGNIYYRINTVDKDGKSDYSKIVVLRLNGGIVKNFTVYPNPFTSNLKMEINSDNETEVTVRIINLSGQTEMTRNISLQKGSNVVVLSSEIQRLNPGMHLMELISADGQTTQKIIKR